MSVPSAMPSRRSPHQQWFTQDPVRRGTALRLLSIGMSQTALARRYGVADQTVLRWIQKDPDAKRAWERGEPLRHPGPTHGTITGYFYYKCRCEACTAANGLSGRQQRAKRSQRDPGPDRHGLASTYQNWNCRCDPCKQAGSIANRKNRERRLAKT